MKAYQIAFVAAAALTGFAPHSYAADLVVMDPMVQEIATGFDWNRPYINVSASYQILPNDAFTSLYATIGIGATSDTFYYGAELTASIIAFPAPNDVLLEGDARLGVLVSDEFLVYGLAGAGVVFQANGGPNIPYGLLGVGGEFAVNDSFSIRAQYQANFYATGAIGHVGKIGASWYF